MNGDGFSDVIIGAEGFTDGQSSEGAAFVFHGSASGLSNAADWTAQSNQSFAFFGNSVSAAGDVNGDGFSDVIIGSWLYDNGLTDEGSVFVYHGSVTGLSASADWFVQSNQSGSGFGSSVSTAGDVNGDGFSEVIVGAPEFDGGTVNEGAAFVYHGSQTGLSAVPDWTAKSNQVDAVFGNAVSSAGDVNGDGYSDVIIGSLNYDNGESNEGRCYVFYGNLVNGLLSAVQQYRPASTNIVCSGGKTGIDGQVKMGIFGKSPFGRAKGKIVHDYVTIGVPFSSINSTLSTGAGAFADLGTLGSELTDDESGLIPQKRLQMAMESTGKEIAYENIVKGYKLDSGYVILDAEDFEAADAIKTKTIEIISFVREEEIDSLYYEQPYYLEPEKSAIKAYALLRDALQLSGKVGVTSFVLRNKEGLAILKPYKNVIVLNRIRFSQEIRDTSELKLPPISKTKTKEMDMANKLVEQLTEKFNISKYKDTYTSKLLKIIKAKSKGKKTSVPKMELVPKQSDNLMEMLEASLSPKRRKSA